MTQASQNQDQQLGSHGLLDALHEEQDLLFNAYFEGDLTAQEREEFETKLDEDDAFRRSYDEFVNIMSGLRTLPFEFAPDDFVDKVESRIRRRSNGRFFAESLLYSSRVPYEVIALVMMVVMAAAWMLMESPRDSGLRTADLTIDKSAPNQGNGAKETPPAKP